MTTAADLRPHRWQADELTRARVALQCAIHGHFPRMEENLRLLPPEALVDLRYALDVMHPIVRAMTQSEPQPCARCGHDENSRDGGHYRSYGYWMCGLCPDGRCQPRVMEVAQ